MPIEEITRIRNSPNLKKLTERQTQEAIVLPILRSLDWNTTNHDEVIFEFSVAAHLKGRADIALCDQRKPLVFIETKAPSVSLSTSVTARDQLFDYCNVAQIDLGVWTNGFIWEFYYVVERNPTPAVVVNISDNDDSELAQIFTTLLSRSALFDGSAERNMRKLRVQNDVQSVWKKMLRDGDSGLARILQRKVNKIHNRQLTVKECQEYIRDQSNVFEKGVQSLSDEGKGLPEPSPITDDPIPPQQDDTRVRAKTNKPIYIVAFGEKRNVRSWQEVKINFFSILIDKHPKLLNDRLYGLCGRQGKEYAVRSSNLERRSFVKPGQIDSRDIWVELNASAKDLVRTCRAVLTILGINQDEFEIFCEDPSYKI